MKIQRKQFEASVPSMAMGDIAFLLLIFFVILARAQDDSHLQWEPAKEQELQRASNSRASIVIDVENKTYLNGREVGVAQLAGALEALLGDAPVGKRVVLLKAHKDATAIYFEPVIEAVSEAGGDLYHILEEERKK
ncbi:MAG: biopolymer transporter ExbD [Verrucomicrobiota bacterium]